VIRVLHIVTTLDVGGAEGQLLEVLSRLDRTRFDLSLAWLKGGGELAPAFERSGIVTRCLGMRRTLDPAVFRTALHLVRRTRPHVVHTHLMKADLVGALAARLAGVPVLLSTKHNEDRHLHVPPVALAALGVACLSDRVVVISDAVRRHLARTTRLPDRRMTRIHYGYPAPANGPDREAARRALRLELDLADDCPVVATVGRLVPQKGIFDLVKAAALLRDAEPMARYVVVGRGPLRRSLAARIEELGLDGIVRLVGFRRDVGRVLAGADLMALPSHWEGFGVVLMEAMAAGTPIVATRVGAIPEVVRDGETGTLVAPRDPSGLATAILRALRNPEQSREMGRAGRRRLETEFRIERAVKDHEALYAELLLERRRRCAR
jgi:glycosyltransferase involved in cell wall biosynthesis